MADEDRAGDDRAGADQAGAERDREREQLIHQLRNLQAEKLALQHLLRKATALIDTLVENDCQEPHRQEAKAEAERLRRAVS